MPDYHAALTAATDAARAAGALLREGLAQPGFARKFDLRAEALLRERLRGATVWGYLSDEADFLSGEDHSHLWLVDPDDGTFHFNLGARGSAIGIAALRDGVPVLGVVYAFAYPDDDGDLIAWAEGCGPITRNGRPIAETHTDAALDDPDVKFDDRLIVYLSPGADHFPHLAAARVAPARYITIPSIAYRLALVGVGEGVATLSLNSPCSWDYAAGHAILRAAGGVFIDQDGVPIRYTREGVSTCVRCFAGGPKAAAALRGRAWTDRPSPAATDSAVRRMTRPARRSPGVPNAATLSRAQGCLLGQVAGDALGGLVEFKDKAEIHSRYPAGCRDLKDGGTWHNLAGQPTDDSELALLLARCLASGGFDEGRILDAYVAWWNDPRTYDRGGTLAQALSAAARGRAPLERLRLADQFASQTSQSNGSLMRVSPLGVFAAGRPELAASLARRDAALTHPHPVCVDSTACYAAAVAVGVAGGGPEAMLRAALAEAVTDEVRRALEAARTEPPADFVRQMGWVLIALQNAFYRLLHAPSLEEGVVETVMQGGDTDTTAAIAGALLGAAHGRDAVPARWRRCVLACRMIDGTPTRHPRARDYWPVDTMELAEWLLLAGS